MADWLDEIVAVPGQIAAWIAADPVVAGVWVTMGGVVVAALTFLTGLRRSKPAEPDLTGTDRDAISASGGSNVRTGDSTTVTGGDGGTVTVNQFTESKYEAQLRVRLDRITDELLEEKDQNKVLLAEKAEIESRLQNIGPAFEDAKARIAELEQILEREGNQLGAERLDRAEAALANGDFADADALLAEIEADEDLAVQRAARAAYGRGKIAEEQVRWHDAAEHYGKAARRHPTYDHLRKARAFAWRAGEYGRATVLGEELIDTARTEFAEDTPEYANALNEHGLTLWNVGRYEDAEPLYRQAIEIGKATSSDTHSEHANHLNNLALLLRDTNRLEEAEPLFKQAMEITKVALGEAHPQYAIRLNNLALLLRDMGLYAEAEPLYREAIEILEATIGEGHPDHATHLNNLAELLRDMGRYAEAEPHHREALEIRREKLGDKHPDVAQSLNNLALLMQDMGKPEEAQSLYADAIGILRKALGDDHPNTNTVAGNYARFLRAHFPDDPALTELEATFGPDIGKA